MGRSGASRTTGALFGPAPMLAGARVCLGSRPGLFSAQKQTVRSTVRMAASSPASAVVSGQWLQDRLGTVKVLDASWYMPNANRKPLEEFDAARVKGALFFDVDGVRDLGTDLPHMLPSEATFAAAMDALGIKNGDQVVFYDGSGLFSAARAWWTFRAFGHDNVSVLEGGLPLWKAEGRPVDTGAPAVPARAGAEAAAAAQKPGAAVKPLYQAKLQPSIIRSAEQVLQEGVNAQSAQVVDARSAGRFNGTAPEPRAGLRGGHIPNSKNVVFSDVLTADGKLKPADELRKIFTGAGLDLTPTKPIIASCGTGVTASVLALALHSIGRPDVAVYDGSWTEWGGRADLPVVK